MSACAPTEIAGKEQLFGCYSYNGKPVLTIDRDKVASPYGAADDFTDITGFIVIRDEELVETKNPILFDPERGLRFGSMDTGFFNIIERGPHGNALLVRTGPGKDDLIKFIRSGATCPMDRATGKSPSAR